MDTNNYPARDNFNPGNHLCCIYKTDNEMLSLIIPFFIDGLKKGNKCIFILGDESQKNIIKAFNDFGFDLSFYLSKKDFEFITHKDIYFKDGVFDATVITSILKDAESEALKQGYSALRVAGSTSLWAIEDTPIIEKLLKYEGVVNEFIDSSYIIATCLYKERSFKEDTLTNIILKHPLVYLSNKLIENTYYTYSSNKRDETLPKISYEEMIRNLIKS
jgi:KaiC/GvpD/RAD55 family RecA-like ATPase